MLVYQPPSQRWTFGFYVVDEGKGLDTSSMDGINYIVLFPLSIIPPFPFFIFYIHQKAYMLHENCWAETQCNFLFLLPQSRTSENQNS